MDPANPVMATIHAHPASPCRALQPGGTLVLRPAPDRLRAPAHDTSGPVAAQATARAGQRERRSASSSRGSEAIRKPYKNGNGYTVRSQPPVLTSGPKTASTAIMGMAAASTTTAAW